MLAARAGEREENHNTSCGNIDHNYSEWYSCAQYELCLLVHYGYRYYPSDFSGVVPFVQG